MSAIDAIILLMAVLGGYVSVYYSGKTNGYNEGYDDGYRLGLLSGAARVALNNVWEQALCERTREGEE